MANILESGSSRGEQLQAINEPLWCELSEHVAAGRLDDALGAYERRMLARNATYMARESGRGEADEAEPTADGSLFAGEGYAGLALAAMTAIAGRSPTTLILNVASQGAWSDFAPDDVVEVPCLVDEHGPRPLAQPPMPEVVRPLVAAVKAYERLTIEAAVTGSYGAALKALASHPLVASFSLARKILDDYLIAHRALLPQFAGIASDDGTVNGLADAGALVGASTVIGERR